MQIKKTEVRLPFWEHRFLSQHNLRTFDLRAGVGCGGVAWGGWKRHPMNWVAIPEIRATGPPIQATGPPQTGAGVEIVMKLEKSNNIQQKKGHELTERYY